MEKKCDECGTTFETRTNAAKRERFCSKKCRVRFWNHIVYRQAHPEKTDDDRQRECVSCRKLFVAPIHAPNAQTCSTKCSELRFNEARKARREARRDVEPRCCKECGAAFVPSKFSWHRHSYCSQKCAQKSTHREYAKRHPERIKANSIVSNGRRWGGNWKAALERDGYKCQACGAEHGLHVHHRDGSGETDSPNHELSNLQTLCRTCHKRIHTITYRIVDGQVVVSGLVFELLGVTSVKVTK